MATAAESRARERQRIKSGVMNGMSRLILYSDRPGEGEQSRWSQLVLTDVKGIPPGIEANYKLSKNLRKQRVGFTPKDKDIEPFKSVVFCRVEEGKPRGFPLFSAHCFFLNMAAEPLPVFEFRCFFAETSRSHFGRTGACLPPEDLALFPRAHEGEAQHRLEPCPGVLPADLHFP